MTENQHGVARKEFSKQAPRFGEGGFALTSREYLQWIVDHLELQSHYEVLDVAAGTGHLGRAIAPHVRRVVALDLTPEMLLEGGREAEKGGVTNIVFEQGLAEDIPYPNDSFDMVVSRFSFHHFEKPHIQIGEMVRVCRPGGTMGVIDLVAPEDEVLAARYNRVERLRDPSHTRALSAGELKGLVRNARLDIVQTASREVEVSVHRWLDLAGTEPEGRRTILEELAQELKGSSATGMRAFMRDNELMYLQTWVIVTGVKIV